MCREASVIHLGFSREVFEAGAHICLVFRDEFERRKIVSRYIESGVLEDEKVSYFADAGTPSEVTEWLASMDVDITGALEHHSFLVEKAADTYCPDGTFEPDRMIDTLKEVYVESRISGYPNARVTGEMTWALQGMPGSERLIEYESGINSMVKTHPITAMCQYDANKFSGSLVYKALQVHPYMVVNGQLLKNPYYISEEQENRRE
ncbi:MAG: MEDS domain-containing protein [Spirochaetia bacterium]